MTRTGAASLVVLALLSFGLTGCGDDGDGEETSTDRTSDAGTDPADGSDDDADGSDDDADGSDDSGDVPDTPPTLTEGPGDVTVTFAGGEDELGGGSFDSSEVTITVGQVVEFQAGDGGTYAVEVGGLDGLTIHGGLKQFYRFDAAGSYPVEEDISGATMTVVVE